MSLRSCLLLLLPAALLAQAPSPAGPLSQYEVNRFSGATIQAMTTDAAGNVYITGTTSALDFPVANAAQPSLGGSTLQRSLDRGASWLKLANPPKAPVAIAPHPVDPQTLLIGTGDGSIYKSTDGGQSWRSVYSASPDASSMIASIATDPGNPLLSYAYVNVSGTFLVSILASSDGGESWQPSAGQPAQPALTVGPLWVDPNGSGAIGLGQWLSRDHGATWTQMASLPGTNSGKVFTVPDPHHSGWIYAERSPESYFGILLSKDWGATWNVQGNPRGTPLQSLLVDPDMADTLYAIDPVGHLAISSDDGVTFNEPANSTFLNSARLPAALTRKCNGGALIGDSEYGVQSSPDFGVTWWPQALTGDPELTAGAGCAFYALSSAASNAFVAKLAPGGKQILWSTYLGGSGKDAAVAIALDPQGNVYVAGNTTSTDFPTTAPRIGVKGSQNVFVAKYDSGGHVTYSLVFGGEAIDVVMGFAVSAAGEAHIAGGTTSRQFPVTPGASETQPGQDINPDYDGFGIKLGPSGTVDYISYIREALLTVDFNRNPFGRVSVAIETSGAALYSGGSSSILYRMTADGSQLGPATTLPGFVFALQTGTNGGIYAVTQANRDPGFCSIGAPPSSTHPTYTTILVTELQGKALQPVFSNQLTGSCYTLPGTPVVSPAGEVTLSLVTYGDFSVLNPVYMAPLGQGAMITRLSADGSSLLFSTFADSGLPVIAVAPDGSIYSAAGGSIELIPVPLVGPQIQGIFNAFDGTPRVASPGGLLTITGANLAFQVIDLGLNNSDPLPHQLGGVQVLFDGNAAEMFRVAPDEVICVVPSSLANSNWVTMQVVSGEQKIAPTILPNIASPGFANTFGPIFGLLTRAFPDIPVGPVDGNIRNADGSLNDAEHPAAPGSTVTLFATGLTTPGSVPLLWNAPQPRGVNDQLVSGTARPMRGFIDAIWAIDFQIPNAPGPGIYTVPVPGVLTRFEFGYVGRGVGVYVK